ncbi:MAG: hypothetical protein CMI29_08490 [Opitutae bacterium]|nr:hypothetical protein [Opitutae bacterium]
MLELGASAPLGGRGDPKPLKTYPFKIWFDSDAERECAASYLERIDGQLHYVPVAKDRAQFAFFWLFFQATTPRAVEPPTVAQLRNLPRVVALARGLPLWQADSEVKHALKDLLRQSNPPLPFDPQVLADAREWYNKLSSACVGL